MAKINFYIKDKNDVDNDISIEETLSRVPCVGEYVTMNGKRLYKVNHVFHLVESEFQSCDANVFVELV
jgi:hypothetical protein